MSVCHSIWLLIRALFRNRAQLAVENLALRQQLAILKEKTKRPKLRPRDRVFWVWLSRFWANWRSALLVVQPDTVLRWHRQGFKLYWRWKSQTGKVGRPKIELEIRRLIRRMSQENPSWGVPRIQSELALLGHTVSEATVRKYRIRKSNPPSQTWRTFLDNHLTDIVCHRLLHRPDSHVPHTLCLCGNASRPPVRPPFQRHSPSDRCLDSTANRRSIPRGHGALVPNSRSRRHLWSRVSAARPKHGNRGSRLRAALALAESLL